MRRLLLALAFSSLLSTASWSASAPSDGHVWLFAKYPDVTAEAGETTTIDLAIKNKDLPPTRAALSIEGIPKGWTAVLMGGDRPVAAVMADTDSTVDLQLRLEIPDEEEPGTHTLTVRANGEDIDQALPIKVTLAHALPAKLDLTAQLPSVRGAVDSTFEYDFKLKNESSQRLVASLEANAPSGFKTTFTEQYGSQELTSIPVDGGKSKDLKLKVDLPAGAKAGEYKLMVRASAKGATADMPLTLQATGQPKLSLASETERLNAEAEAGETTQIQLVVSNDGSAAAENVSLSSSPPSGWKVEFSPKSIERLEPKTKKTVTAFLTPSEKAITGDYMTTMKASAGSESDSAEFRIAVTTSTLWGIFGLGIIAIALLVLFGAVVRFGRR